MSALVESCAVSTKSLNVWRAVTSSIGASGAIAAVMGAFLVTYPRDKIRTILIIGFFVRITFIPAALLIG